MIYEGVKSDLRVLEERCDERRCGTQPCVMYRVTCVRRRATRL